MNDALASLREIDPGFLPLFTKEKQDEEAAQLMAEISGFQAAFLNSIKQKCQLRGFHDQP